MPNQGAILFDIPSPKKHLEMTFQERDMHQTHACMSKNELGATVFQTK